MTRKPHKVRAQAAHDIYLYGSVESELIDGIDCITPLGVVQELQKAAGASEINIHLFSGGGDVFAGMAIYETLSGRTETVNIYIEGLAASAATIIAMAADKIYIAPTAMFMIHQPWTFFSGNAVELREQAAELEKMCDMYANVYASRTGRSVEFIKAQFLSGDADIWLTAHEAVENGFADKLTPQNKLPAQAVASLGGGRYSCRGAVIDLSEYPNAPSLHTARNNHKGAIAKMNKKIARGRKIRAEVIEVECPYCGAANAVDSDTTEAVCAECGQTFEMPAAEGDAPVVARKRAKPRAKRGFARLFRAQAQEVTCPYCQAVQEAPEGVSEMACESCGGVFEIDQQAADAPPAEPEPQARKRAAVMRSELYTIACPNCGVEFEWDSDPANEPMPIAQGKVRVRAEVALGVVCPECGYEFEFVPPGDANTDAAAEVVAAVRNERIRMEQLDVIAEKFPQAKRMVDAAKKSGTSVSTVRGNILRVMGNANANQGRLNRLKADAQGVVRAGQVNLPASAFTKAWAAKGRIKE